MGRVKLTWKSHLELLRSLFRAKGAPTERGHLWKCFLHYKNYKNQFYPDLLRVSSGAGNMSVYFPFSWDYLNAISIFFPALAPNSPPANLDVD